ncbi:hypothetical protein [Pseudomonas viridiflava]|uniref:Uncharacterized protein n=1 Tax=Pseudomonas viridiflava TaxID=33069 RepID=A0AA46VW22_PSEVI|nr:hypothetical protein [Pseudomonas viridiflava]UZA67549.1 hypothetical protein EZZ81_04625 [Pseudomonas viridiflava]
MQAFWRSLHTTCKTGFQGQRRLEDFHFHERRFMCNKKSGFTQYSAIAHGTLGTCLNSKLRGWLKMAVRLGVTRKKLDPWLTIKRKKL